MDLDLFLAILFENSSYSSFHSKNVRTVEIVFEPGAAEVVAADTFGYCGLGAEFAGRYRIVE